ncbi:MAG: response regulator, partial [Rhodospirillaceae bacterium]|nr:response regulator [Rhodospirillaceae bacterium]
MPDDNKTVEEKITALRDDYAQRLASKIDEISSNVLLISSSASKSDAGKAIAAVHALTHKLAGSGETFGFKEISIVARKMEEACTRVMENEEDPASIAETLVGKLEALKKSGSHPDVRMEKQGEQEADSKDSGTVDDRAVRNVLILDGDEKVRLQMVGELEHFGFVARGISHPNDILSAIKEQKPDVLVSDTIFDGNDNMALDIISGFHQSGELDCPIIIHTKIDNMSHRLGAVRAGAGNYLVKPVDMADMIDVLDSVTENGEADLFRVLVIDDDESLSRHTELVLQGAGMMTSAL